MDWMASKEDLDEVRPPKRLGTAFRDEAREHAMLTVVCVKWGNWCYPHAARYVNNLYHGVRANLTLEHRFVCFTDDPADLDPGIEVRALPKNLTGFWWDKVYARCRFNPLRTVLGLPYLFLRRRDVGRGLDDVQHAGIGPVDLRGWYNKLYLFKPGVLSGPCVFLDLDTAIVGNLDEIFQYEGDLCILRDFHRQLRFGSGLIAFRAEAMAPVWNEFVRRSCPVMHSGDQQFIQEVMKEADFFQDLHPGRGVSYRVPCRKGGVPAYARVVCFHGPPRPHEIEDPLLLAQWDRPKDPTPRPSEHLTGA